VQLLGDLLYLLGNTKVRVYHMPRFA
jgi:hypothetical protein